jgi:hypothetical protein
VQNNGSIYRRVVVTKHGYSIDPDEHESYSTQYVFLGNKRLNKYKRKAYQNKTVNFLTENAEQHEEYQKKADDKMIELLSY